METIKILKSSGNVFEDMGLPSPNERLRKAELAFQINSVLSEKHLKQKEAATLLGIPQSKVSLLRNGKLKGFSLEKLIEFVEALDQEVELTIVDPKSVTVKSLSIKGMVEGFIFPVVDAVHPLLAKSLPKWDYTGEFCHR